MNRWLTFFIFSFLFSLVYGGIHFYLYRRIRSYTHFPKNVYRGIILFFVIMVFSPVLCRLVTWERFFYLGRIMIYLSSLWIGLAFYLFLVNLILDLANGAYRLLRRALRRRRDLLFPRNYKLFLPILMIPLAICIYAYYEALNIQITPVRIHTTKLPKGTKELVIAQISDAHLGVIIGEKRLKKVTALLRDIQPDMIVSTGDLLDQEVDSINHLAEELGALNPPLGKYAVLGNHEFYAGVEKSCQFIKKAGFRLLRGEQIEVQGLINIIGIDDPTGERFGKKEKKDPANLTAHCDPRLFTLFLYHRPSASEDYIGHLPIDLQLSGHTHDGQLFPFRLITRIFFPRYAGLYKINGRRLYVSRGVGTWGPPLRFMSPPEIAVIRLIRDPSR